MPYCEGKLSRYQKKVTKEVVAPSVIVQDTATRGMESRSKECKDRFSGNRQLRGNPSNPRQNVEQENLCPGLPEGVNRVADHIGHREDGVEYLFTLPVDASWCFNYLKL